MDLVFTRMPGKSYLTPLCGDPSFSIVGLNILFFIFFFFSDLL